MPKKSSYLEYTDMYCGAGGSSSGAKKAATKLKLQYGTDIKLRLGLNHWARAIETHETNFPEADHACTDVQACDPRWFSSTDILIGSPECTNHSLGKGKKFVKQQMRLYEKNIIDPAAERSRATMWDIPRFAEYHNYNIVITENVVDARKWIQFDAWILSMHLLGYKHKCVYLNSMFCYPTPQSRDRMYVVFWKKGNKAPDLEICPLAFCDKCSNNVNALQTWKKSNVPFGKYGDNGQYIYSCPTCYQRVNPYYYAAFNAIDWSIKGNRIGDRKKPLAENSERRIRKGLEMYGNQLISPFLINNQQSTGVESRIRSVVEHVQTIPTEHHMNIVMPFILKQEHTKQNNLQAMIDPTQTQTTTQSMGMIYVPYIVEANSSMKLADEATSTITAGGINHSLVHVPIIVTNKGQSNAHRSLDPMSGVTTKLHHGVITSDSWNAFISYNNNGGDQVSHILEAGGTQHTKHRLSVIAYETPKYEDCYYRMLRSHEVQAAMAFDDTYIVTGNVEEQIQQLGNAVTPPAMELLFERSVRTLL